MHYVASEVWVECKRLSGYGVEEAFLLLGIEPVAYGHLLLSV
jgi:hypothetical protein